MQNFFWYKTMGLFMSYSVFLLETEDIVTEWKDRISFMGVWMMWSLQVFVPAEVRGRGGGVHDGGATRGLKTGWAWPDCNSADKQLQALTTGGQWTEGKDRKDK